MYLKAGSGWSTDASVAVFISVARGEEETGVDVVGEVRASGLLLAKLLALCGRFCVNSNRVQVRLIKATDGVSKNRATGLFIVGTSWTSDGGCTFRTRLPAFTAAEEEALTWSGVRVGDPGEMGARIQHLTLLLARRLIRSVLYLGQD